MKGLRRYFQRVRRGAGDGLEPSRHGVGLLASVLGDDEMAFVPVRDSADLRDVPVVDAKGADSAPLERGVQAAEVLPHPVREHLGLAGAVPRNHGPTVWPPNSA